MAFREAATNKSYSAHRRPRFVSSRLNLNIVISGYSTINTAAFSLHFIWCSSLSLKNLRRDQRGAEITAVFTVSRRVTKTGEISGYLLQAADQASVRCTTDCCRLRRSKLVQPRMPAAADARLMARACGFGGVKLRRADCAYPQTGAAPLVLAFCRQTLTPAFRPDTGAGR